MSLIVDRCKLDVLVLGAGPAGCAAAIRCADAGLSVRILERQAFPRDAPGETLHPGTEVLFRELGAAPPVLARGFLRHAGHWVRWGGPERWQPFGHDASSVWLGFQAWRAELDALLLDRARTVGVEVVQSCSVLTPLQDHRRVTGVLTDRGVQAAHWVVDATGGRGRLSRGLGLRVERRSPPLIAYYGWVEGECPARDEAPTLTADADGWTWIARVGPGRYAWTRLAVDGRRCDRDWLPQELHSLRPCGRTRGADVTWRKISPCAGPGYFLAGDAAAVLDPAASHGVLKALMTGMLAADRIVAVHTGLVHEAVAARSYDAWVEAWWQHDVARLNELYQVFPAWKSQRVGSAKPGVAAELVGASAGLAWNRLMVVDSVG